MSTIDRSLLLSISALASLVVALVSPNPAEAAEIKVTTNFQQSASTRTLCTLGAAIKAANSAMAVDGCPAGATGVMNVITLPAQSNAFRLLLMDNNTDGPNGLPSITSNLSINGNGATIRSVLMTDPNLVPPENRQPMVNGFAAGLRLFHVAASGRLTLNGVNLGGFLLGSDGAGAFNRGTLIVKSSTFSGLEANTGRGGGIFNEAGRVTVDNTVMRSMRGVGIFNNKGSVQISRSSIGPTNFAGSGVLNDGGTMFISHTAIYKGDPERGGIGAVLNRGGGSMTIKRSTIGENKVGGIANLDGTITITNCTIAGNQVFGIKNDSGGEARMQNTILDADPFGRPQQPDFIGHLTSLGNNYLHLLGRGWTYTRLQGVDVFGDGEISVDTLVDDPLPGQAHFPLLPPGIGPRHGPIDHGNDSACTGSDQLLQPRVGAHCDIGAVEFQGP